jgi:hypothetical protein
VSTENVLSERLLVAAVEARDLVVCLRVLLQEYGEVMLRDCTLGSIMGVTVEVDASGAGNKLTAHGVDFFTAIRDLLDQISAARAV